MGPQEKHVFIYTLHGIRRLRCLWMSSREPEHTVVSHEAAKRYSLRVNSRRQATRTTGPTGVAVGLDTDYEMFLLMDDLPGRTKQILAHGVESVGEFWVWSVRRRTNMRSSWEGIMQSFWNNCEESSRTGREPTYRTTGGNNQEITCVGRERRIGVG